MKILAIDYGEKRIGLAVGDSENKIAFSRGIIENSSQIYKELSNFCKKETIEKIIVGLPLSLGGGDSAQTKQTREFVSRPRFIVNKFSLRISQIYGAGRSASRRMRFLFRKFTHARREFIFTLSLCHSLNTSAVKRSAKKVKD